MVRELLIFGGGAVVGGLVTYAICKKVYDDREEEADRNIADEFDALSEDELVDILKEMGYDAYTQPAEVNPIYDDDEDDDEEEGEEDDTPSPIEPNPFPYPIGPEQYGEDDFEAVTLSWYKDDRTMADEDLEILPEWTDLIGNIESMFENADDDSVYIRNEVQQTDYEICIHSDSYKHAVMGEDDEELGDMADE